MTEEEINSKPIGVFDSGIGGLTVLKEIIKCLPNEDIVYLGDTARVPYGIRSPSTVIRYSYQNAEFLIKQGIKALVVACNTVSAIGIEKLSVNFAVPIIGVIEPGAITASKVSKKRRVGVIGTEATIKSGAYQRILSKIIPGVEILAKPCPLFVPLVEEGWTAGSITKAVIKEYLQTLKRRQVDTLVLGCTHYPLLKSVLGEYMGNGTVLIDSAVETAKEAKEIIRVKGLLASHRREGKKKFYVTDSPERFKDVGERFLGESICDITLVDIP